MLFVMAVGQDPAKVAGFHLTSSPIPLKPDAAADFPVSLCVDQKDDLTFLMTNMSYLYMYDIHIGKTLHRAKITANTVFVTCIQESTGTLFGIPVTSCKVFRVLMNGHALVPYNPPLPLRDNDLAVNIARHLNLTCAENL